MKLTSVCEQPQQVQLISREKCETILLTLNDEYNLVVTQAAAYNMLGMNIHDTVFFVDIPQPFMSDVLPTVSHDREKPDAAVPAKCP
jgi:hypothetical protein